MQSASANYIAASSAAGGVWADPNLYADWLRDGVLSADGTTLVIADDFNRLVNNGLGVTDTGHTWISVNGSASDYLVDGSAAVHSVTGNGQVRHSLISGVSMLTADQTIGVLGPVPTGDPVEAGVLFARYLSDTEHYRFGIIINLDATVTALIVRAHAGETVLTTAVVPGLTFTANKALLVNGHMTPDNLLQMKVWREDLAVPTVWHAQVTDNTISDPGMVGFRSAVYPSNTNAKPVRFRYTFYRAVNGAIDDLRRQLGSWSVEHHLDDGYPDSATFISGIGTPTLNAELTAPPAYHTNQPMQTREYYSPYNRLSPLFGLDRDVAPITLDHGIVTSAGQERIRVFTGQMADIPVKRGEAMLQAVSATRLKLSRLVQPPAVNGAYSGANALFPISYALAACGVYASPPPQPGCRLWAPQHGSPRSFIPNANLGQLDTFIYTKGSTGPQRELPVRFCDGPFTGAIEYGCNTEHFQRYIPGGIGIVLEPGQSLGASNTVGKFELWVRGDAFDASAATLWGQTVPTSIVRMLQTGGGPSVDVLIRSDNRNVQAALSDGVNSGSVTGGPLPTDGEWHFVGFAWDIANKRVWVNLDGTVTTATIPALVPANFTIGANGGVDIRLGCPAAEMQLTTGVTGSSVNPTIGGWLRDIPFTPGAIVSPSTLDLMHVVEREPTEAWELISRYAQAELASMRTDENDVFNYFTAGWWVKDAQQVIAETYSTEFNTGTVDINVDPTKIRNEAIVSYDEVLSLGDNYQVVYSSTEVYRVPTGTSLLVVPFSDSGYEIRTFAFTNIVAATVTQPNSVNSVSFNAAMDGSSTYYDALQCSATIIDWNPGSATIQLVNTIPTDVFLANNKSWPSLTVASKAVDTASANVTESDATSVAVRGERSLSVSAPVLQTRLNARRLARRLVSNLRFPQPVAEELELFGEARRQPGDLVTFEDPSMTKVSGSWRTQSVKHSFAADEGEASYTNQVIVRPTRNIMIVGEGLVGYTLIGPQE